MLWSISALCDEQDIQSALFLSVCASFASMMRPDLSPDPNEAIQSLLRTIIASLNTTAVDALPAPLLIQTNPSTTTVWVQCLLYASITCSLFAALGAVMGKQWLDHYRSVGEHGTIEARGMERQRKLASLDAWNFRAILEVHPVLVQVSLLLFAVALSAYMLEVNRFVALILIITNSIGFLLYFSSIVASLLYADCPFQSSLTGFLRILVDLFLTALAPLIDIFRCIYFGCIRLVMTLLPIIFLCFASLTYYVVCCCGTRFQSPEERTGDDVHGVPLEHTFRRIRHRMHAPMRRTSCTSFRLSEPNRARAFFCRVPLGLVVSMRMPPLVKVKANCWLWLLTVAGA